MLKTPGAKRVFIFFAAFILLSVNAFSASIGLSPGITEFKDVLRGDYSEKSVVLSTSSTTPLECEIIASGPAEHWFTYSTGERFTIPPQNHFSLTIMVQPPADTPNGVYSGLIMVRILPQTSNISGTGATLSTGVALKYSVEVSDQETKDYRVNGAALEYTREGIGYTEEKKPFNFLINMENTGNVRLVPKIKIEILSEDKSEVLASKEYSEKTLLPTTRQEVIITIPNNLPIGKYFAKITADIPSNPNYVEYLPIEVAEKGSLSISGRQDQVKLNKIWVTPGELVEVTSLFTNDGVISTPAQFKGKVTELNSEEEGSVVSLLESDEVEVAPGQTAELITYYTPTQPGRYLISGKVRFSKKETGEKSSILNVIAKAPQNTTTTETTLGQANGGMPDITIVAGIVAVIAIIVGAYLWGTKKKPKKKAPQVKPPAKDKSSAE